jgi:hypothetical protein
VSKETQSGLLFDPLEKLEAGELEELWERLEKRPKKKTKEKTMSEERDMGGIAIALERMNDRLDDLLSDKRRRRGRDREDEPESVREMDDRGRRGEARQVAFEVKVPVGRQGGTLKGLLIFDVSVRDDRDLEDLANEVERKFRSANVFTKDFNRGGYGGGNGYGGGGYRRDYYDRDYRR